MNVFEAIILGIIQGLTEFLPISSTGHLLLGRKLFGLDEAGLLLDTMLHFGKLLAVVIVFWKDVVEMIKHPFSKLSLLIVVGTIPTVIIALTFKGFFEEISITGKTVGVEFIITGIILWLADSMKNGTKTLETISFNDALLIGTLQGAAILPAISRSGLTIAGSLFRGINKSAAARFSFLLSLPAILGATVLEGSKLTQGVNQQVTLIPLLIGTLFAAISGYYAIKWMLRILQEGSLKLFAIYVWILGASIVVAQLTGIF